MGLDVSPLRLRLIRVELESGEIEVLITSLTDEQKFPYEIFMDLYHKRWPVEVDYLFMKQRIEIGNFPAQRYCLSIKISTQKSWQKISRRYWPPQLRRQLRRRTMRKRLNIS